MIGTKTYSFEVSLCLIWPFKLVVRKYIAMLAQDYVQVRTVDVHCSYDLISHTLAGSRSLSITPQIPSPPYLHIPNTRSKLTVLSSWYIVMCEGCLLISCLPNKLKPGRW